MSWKVASKCGIAGRVPDISLRAIISLVKLPIYLKKYFWEVDVNGLDSAENPEYIIGRILEYGDTGAVRWMLQTFDSRIIKSVLSKRKGLSPLSANYWSLILNVSKNKILCLQKQSQNKLQKTWHY